MPIAVTGGTVNLKISLSLVFNANGSAKIVMGITQELSINEGFKASLDPFTPEIINNTSNTFSFKQPQFEGELSISAAVNPDFLVDVLNYSVAGLNNSFGIKATTKANVTLSNACLRTLAYAELSSVAFVMLPKAALDIDFSWDNFSLTAAIKMEKLSQEIFRYTKPIYDSGDYCLIENIAPVADAGLDKNTNASATVFLNGTGSYDSDGVITSYIWTQTGGAQVALSNPYTATPSFVAPSTAGTLTFRLTVNDNKGATATDYINVSVLEGSTNLRPTANAGTDQTVDTNEIVFLNGTGSYDNGIIASYAWTQTGGTQVILSNATTAAPSFIAPSSVGTLTFKLTVTDNKGATATDYVQISVMASIITPQGVLQVSPSDRFDSSGTQGGPFSPSSKTYTLSNTGGTSISWTASEGQSWASLSQTSGTLSPGTSTTVTVPLTAMQIALHQATMLP